MLYGPAPTMTQANHLWSPCLSAYKHTSSAGEGHRGRDGFHHKFIIPNLRDLPHDPSILLCISHTLSNDNCRHSLLLSNFLFFLHLNLNPNLT